ncbi:MAG: SDR family NAD(P)-dependent oxidoreductase, partial [Chitinophagaceae bacterium]|nr:SDR family NAD(P)-dependent oxidoreductase [Chitinophagaceae bacterium]
MAKNEKIVVITGAAGGIGFSIAEAFIAHDYIAVLLDLNEASVNAATAKLKKNHAIGYACD